MGYQFGKTSQEALATVGPRLRRVMYEAIKDSPIDFGVPKNGGFRTADEQHRLFLEKKSTLDGYSKKSYHQTGLAVDIFAYVDGKASYARRHLMIIAGHIIGTANRLGEDIVWGGDWDGDWDIDEHDFIDMPHYQMNEN